MTQIIVIKEPCPFYSQQDEDSFFEWLQSIPEVKSVKGCANGLEILLKEPIGEDSLIELIAVFSRYSLKLKPLKDLCSPNNEKWFKDPIKFWYSEIFS